MTEETQALVDKARAATAQLRDAARQVMDHRQRDPLVLAVHAALDRLDTTDRALTALARDLETARQERDAVQDKLTLALATSDLTDADLTRTVETIAERMGRAMEAECRRQIEAAEASRDAAVRAARAETWAQAERDAGEADAMALCILFGYRATAAREGQ